MISRIKIVLSIVTFSFLVGCGGDRSHSTPQSSLTTTDLTNKSDNVEQNSSLTWIAGEYPDWRHLGGICANPNQGELQGTVADENAWIRSFSHDTYLWYRELEDIDPASIGSTRAYFERMKTPEDRFHYYIETKEASAQAAGHSIGYGAKFLQSKEGLVVAYVEPNSPASRQRLSRGAIITAIDGVDIASKDSRSLDAILYYPKLGESHTFEVKESGASKARRITMESVDFFADPVKNQQVFSFDGKTIGYLTFNAHNEPSEQQLISTVREFQQQNIDELVLDLRYNGGGSIAIAAQLGYMIAGTASQEKIFAHLQFNDKHTAFNPIEGTPLSPVVFHPIENALDPSVTDDAGLPVLDLERVFVLAGKYTASASEVLVNGLRGIDFKVVLIGETTVGKPYGFYPMNNCGITYLTIQLKSLNAKNFGDYANGFEPVTTANSRGAEVNGCRVADDFSYPLGNPKEARLATALSYIKEGRCPENTASAISDDEGIQLDGPNQFEGVLMPEFGQILP